MAITNGYITLDKLKAAYLPAGVIASPADDTYYESIIEAASRTVDMHCKRRFYGATETRYYSTEDPYTCYIDDLRTVSQIALDVNRDDTFSVTLAATDYYLWPYNAADNDAPYMAIEIAKNAAYLFPTYRRGIKITGVFGYQAGASTACPAPIADATLLICLRYLERKNTPLGIAGNAQLGEQRVVIPDVSADPDIRDMLEPYKRQL
jgi:hypothetical protein